MPKPKENKIHGRLPMKCGYTPCAERGGVLYRKCIVCEKGYVCRCGRCRYCSGDYKTAKMRERDAIELSLSQRKSQLVAMKQNVWWLTAEIARLEKLIADAGGKK